MPKHRTGKKTKLIADKPTALPNDRHKKRKYIVFRCEDNTTHLSHLAHMSGATISVSLEDSLSRSLTLNIELIVMSSYTIYLTY